MVLRDAAPLPPPGGTSAKDDGESFYFFDIDDNLLFLPTRIYLRNRRTGAERGVTTAEFATVAPVLGRPGPWAEWARAPDAFRDFEDRAGSAPGDSPFVRDLRRALGTSRWRGPSWPYFAHACRNGRSTAYITARGHRPRSILAGLELLAATGHIDRPPAVLAIYPVGNAALRRSLAGDEAVGTPELKRRALGRAVAIALRRHGSRVPHRFGMSDDDPRNVQALVKSMCALKLRHPRQRFFVIDTHAGEHAKLEVFPMEMPVAGQCGQKERT